MKWWVLMAFFYATVGIYSSNAIYGQTVDSTYKKFYYPSGKLSSEGRMLNGKADGYWKTYHENGKLKSEGNRRNFELDSLWRFYDENGKMTVTFNYRDGKKNGIKTVYDTETGLKISEEPFADDVRNGKSFFYKEDYIYREVPYTAGKENGLGLEYTREKLIQTLLHYKAGFLIREEKINRVDKFNRKQGVWKEFYPNMTVKREMRYRDDKLDGYLKEFEPDGNLKKAEKYVDGVLVPNAAELVKLDTKKTYYESGKVKTSGTFKEGVPEGFQRRFSEEGIIIGSELYKDGYKIGEGIYDEKGYKQGKWKEYYITGQLKGEGEYINDKKTGEWIFYHLNGKLEQRGFYTKDGKPTGDWKWYYDHGQLLRSETFVRGRPEGEMIEYNDSGAVVTRGSFMDGEKEGFWMTFDGDVKEEGEYRSGLKSGLWKVYFNLNGRLEEVGTYLDGLENGKHTYYHFNGKVKEEGEFIGGVREGTWKKYDTEGVLYTTIVYRAGKEEKIDGVRVKEESYLEDK